MSYNIENLEIKISNKGIKPIGRKLFTGEVLTLKTYKIYILKKKGKFVYIGKTKQQIGTKFGQGFSAYKHKKEDGKNKNGYGGYKWINKYMDNKLSLTVIDLGEKVSNSYTEAVEAEIVLLIRNTYSIWPECQNEIHFNNEHETATIEAKEIFELIKGEDK